MEEPNRTPHRPLGSFASARLLATDNTPEPGKPQPEPDTPNDPDIGKELPDVNPGSNPANPGDRPGVTEPGKPARVIARH